MRVPLLSSPPLARFLLLFALAVLGLGYFLGYRHILSPLASPTAHADRFVLKEDGDIYSISDTLGEKKLTSLGDVKFLFDRKNGKMLLGKGWEGAVADSERIGGTRIMLMDEKELKPKMLSKELVLEGRLNHRGDKAFYSTTKLDLYAYDTQSGVSKKIQEKALSVDVSPDDKKVVYQKQHPDWHENDYFDQQLGIMVMDLETGEEKMILPTSDAFNPLWTPDGKQILFFAANPDGLASHFIMNADGSEKKQLTNTGLVFATQGGVVPLPSEMPIWSSDGRYLVYESDYTIWVNEFDDARRNIIRAQRIGYGKDVQWAEDGKRISVVVAKSTKGNSGIVIIDLLGNISH